MSCFLLEHVLKRAFAELWIPLPTLMSCHCFSLEEGTVCSTKRILKTWRTPFLLLVTVWFYQMNTWKWILWVSPYRFPAAPIPKRFPGGAHGCSPCTTLLQKTCCQVCVQLASPFRFHCKQLLMLFHLPVWRWGFLKGKTDFTPSCCIIPKRPCLKTHCCLGWTEISFGVGHVSICAVFWVPYLRTKIRHLEVANCSSLN